MKLANAWSETLSQNAAMKWALLALGLATMALTVASWHLALRDPLIIERGCKSAAITAHPGSSTASEVRSFIMDVLPQRFNSDASLKPSMASPVQLKTRVAEQAELTRRSMRQVVVVNGVTLTGNAIRVDADRLVAVGKVRAAFAFPLDITLETTTRSADNPYGLILTSLALAVGKEGSTK